MLKLLLIVLCLILCLLSCTNVGQESTDTAPTNITAIVDWIDFVKFNGQSYAIDQNAKTVSEDSLGDFLGCIENTVPFEIENYESYTVPDNASPSRAVGSEIYAVTDDENAIAVYDISEKTYYLYRLES